MASAEKTTAVAELAARFRSASGAVLTEYRGLTVQQLKELRVSLGDNARYAIVKNTLTRRAAQEAGVDAFDTLLEGPSAIAFISGDAVETAKALRDFARANPPLVIKGGLIDGRPVSAAEIATIADLESREVLLGKLAGAMTATLRQAVYVLQAPLAQAGRLFAAWQAAAPVDETPAMDEAPPVAAVEPVDATDETPTAESPQTTND